MEKLQVDAPVDGVSSGKTTMIAAGRSRPDDGAAQIQLRRLKIA
jgi:hypothetical protein